MTEACPALQDPQHPRMSPHHGAGSRVETPAMHVQHCPGNVPVWVFANWFGFFWLAGLDHKSLTVTGMIAERTGR